MPDGSAWIGDELLGSLDEADALGSSVAARLRLAGAAALLAEAEMSSMAS
jgi:hypothetical protein